MKLHNIFEGYLRRGMAGTEKRPRIPGSKDHEVSHCTRKKKYSSIKNARTALRKCQKHGSKVRSFYPCDYCGNYHLTSQKAGGISRT